MSRWPAWRAYSTARWNKTPLKCRRPGSVPPLARLADVSKVMGLPDGPAACRLSAQR